MPISPKVHYHPNVIFSVNFMQVNELSAAAPILAAMIAMQTAANISNIASELLCVLLL